MRGEEACHGAERVVVMRGLRSTAPVVALADARRTGWLILELSALPDEDSPRRGLR